MTEWDAVVVGAGPNGLSAALTIARASRSVLLLEGHERVGGGSRSAALTLPGFVHDVCSSVHPLAVASPAFRSFGLERFGLRWVHPRAPLAHPFDDRPAALLHRSLEETAASLGEDGDAWRRLFSRPSSVVNDIFEADELDLGALLGLLRKGVLSVPAALSSTSALVRRRFRGDDARALFAGMAAHSVLALERRPSAGFGLALGALGHTVGWPFPEGGAQGLADALRAAFEHAGGVVETGREVRSLDELPSAHGYLLDLSPRAVARVCGARLPKRYRAALEAYRHGPGALKVDYALSGPIPWRDERCQLAGTVHLGGSLEKIEASERAPWEGRVSLGPFVLLTQTSLFDPTRAPPGQHSVWAYCHVPNGSDEDAAHLIDAQIERFAPGFRSRVLSRNVITARALEAYNPSYVGGDINAGVMDLAQVLRRPTLRAWSTPLDDVWICSAATPPGGGVHGMCGFFAAQAALRSGTLG